MKNRDVARTPEALAALQAKDRDRRERRKGAPWPNPKLATTGKTVLYSPEGGEPITSSSTHTGEDGAVSAT